MKKYTFLILSFITAYLFAVPPHPQKTTQIPSYPKYNTEIFKQNQKGRSSNLPDSILVLRVQFQDVKFKIEPSFPDSFPHDRAYFERFMFHLSSYLHDASYENYILTEDNYSVIDTVFTLPETMEYYGDDSNQLERVSLMSKQTIEMADDIIDFSNYDSFIIFHAGAGQEADINSANPEQIYSTFLTRKSLQEGLEPENDNYQGIITSDGKYVKEIIICPETEWQPDFEEGDTNYQLFGILTYLFCRQMGLPTLFNNVGAGNGIGDFGIMGTGAWNANGHVPPLPCAWSRYYMGWEEDNIEEINFSDSDFEITFPMAKDDFTPKLYKINITEEEYFLLENRQQNPDNSTLNGFPNFTFQLAEDQDYYPPPNDNIPRFNFMKNTYLGCEWDFYLPGPGFGSAPGPDEEIVDGSGLFIWHIDEEVIAEKFQPEEGINIVNSVATHKGVDLEEADGIQHMDALISIKSWGSAYDSFRADNNAYFGKAVDPFTGYTSQPTSNSYYGKTILEIYNISISDSLMTFSVNFYNRFKTEYVGRNIFPASVVDFDDDGSNEIFYPMPNGELYFWKDDEIYENFQISPLAEYFAYDEQNRTFLLPTYDEDASISILYTLFFENNNSYIDGITFNNKTWATAPVVTNNDLQRVILALDSENNTQLVSLDCEYTIQDTVSLSGNIASNLIYKDDKLHYIDENKNFVTRNLQDLSLAESLSLNNFNKEKAIHSVSLADINGDNKDNLIITSSDSLLYVYEDEFLLENYPAIIPLNKFSLPTFADTDGNGKLEIILGGENTFVSFDQEANIFCPHTPLPASDSTSAASGVVASDLDGDEIPEIIGSFSKNRISVWENELNNNFYTVLGTTYALNSSSSNFPIIAEYMNKTTVFIAADNGELYKIPLEGFAVNKSIWNCEYGNLQRTSAFSGNLPQNIFVTKKVFVNQETYIYPNPFSSIYNRSIFRGETRENEITIRVMTSKNTKVKIKIFDIAGGLVKQKTQNTTAYLPASMSVDVSNIASGVYCAILEADGESKQMMFAVEK